jgi:hypothetical protein
MNDKIERRGWQAARDTLSPEAEAARVAAPCSDQMMQTLVKGMQIRGFLGTASRHTCRSVQQFQLVNTVRFSHELG